MVSEASLPVAGLVRQDTTKVGLVQVTKTSSGDGALRLGLETYEIAVPTLPPAVLINDPKNLEFVLKNHEVFVKGKFFHSNSWDLFGLFTSGILTFVAHCLLGNGILNADGDLWRIQRKAALRFLSRSNLQHFMDDMLPPLLRDMHRRLDTAARTGTVIDLESELLELTTHLMGRIAYNVR